MCEHVDTDVLHGEAVDVRGLSVDADDGVLVPEAVDEAGGLRAVVGPYLDPLDDVHPVGVTYLGGVVLGGGVTVVANHQAVVPEFRGGQGVTGDGGRALAVRMCVDALVHTGSRVGWDKGVASRRERYRPTSPTTSMDDTPPDADLSETVALVTGASRGVGRGIAHELGVGGATVYVTGRSTSDDRTDGLPGTVDGTADLVSEAGGEGVAVVCDHTDDAAVEALFERIEGERGRLDLLVNGVWGGYEGYDDTFDAPFWEQPRERFDAMFDAGVRAAYVASQLAAPLLFESDRALLVNVSAGDGEHYRGQVAYDTAKAAVDRMAKGMAHELRAHAVAVLVVYPGFTRTERVMEAMDGEEPEGVESPRYVSRAVAALAGDESVLEKSGGIYRTGGLAREYGFTDVDGSQPAPFDLETPVL